MTSIRLMASIVLLALVVAASNNSAQTQPAASTTDLRCKLAPGQEVRYEWRQQMLDSMSMGGGQPADRENSYVATLLVRMTDEGDSREAELTFESLKVHVKTLSTVMDFDSSSAPEQDGGNALAPAYRPIVGVKLKLKLDENGNIVNVAGGESLLQTTVQTARVRAQIIDKDIVQRKFGPLFSTGKSAERVAAGETWSTTEIVPLSSSIKVTVPNKHTLTEIKGDDALIKIEGIADENQPSTEKGAAQAKSVQNSGETTWDARSGQLREHSLKQKIVLKIERNGIMVRTDAEVNTSLKRES
jgi:hypothetical protein